MERRGWRLRWVDWRRRHQAGARACQEARHQALGRAVALASPVPEQRQVLPTPTAEQWAAILALVEEADANARRRPLPQQPILEGILWMMRHNRRWQDIPDCFGRWKTIESRYYRWCKTGIWAQILRILRSPPIPDPAPT